MAQKKRVMVVGSGAREHALCWKLSQSPEIEQLWCAPGNAGTMAHATSVRVAIDDTAALVSFAQEHRVDLVVIGPEGPLVSGLVDALEHAGISAFGPRQAAARLEGSKVFSKEFMRRWNIPTAPFNVFTDAAEAVRHVEHSKGPVVVKADGLAGGKGVVVADSSEEATAGIRRIMEARVFGAAGEAIVIEDRLYGQEVSYHVISDGTHFVRLASAQDHKRLLDGDLGPNTGGMGAYSPAPIVTPRLETTIMDEVVEPTLRGMAQEGAPFRGALFVGLMIVDDKPVVLEYNVRFGDPEAEVMLARLRGDLFPLLWGSARGAVGEDALVWGAPASLCVVLAANGYPGAVSVNNRIAGLDRASRMPGVHVFHGGTQGDGGAPVTSGGRVLTVTAVGDAMSEARRRAYEAVDVIHFDGAQCRRDIGRRILGHS